MASRNILLSPEAEEIIASNGNISKILSIVNNEENQLYISWVNNVLINFNGKVSSNRAELADAITKSAIDTLGDKWANSAIRTFLNQLRKHVRGEEFTQPWNNGVLSSIAAVITKGDDWEILLNFMQSKGMTDYRIAFSFYGILNGFANLTRDFTDILLNQKSIYVAEIYREFYGQLHGITIDINKKSNIEVPKEKQEEFIKETHEMLVSTHKECAENNDLREQQCKEIWEFFNNSPAVPKSGNKKEKLQEGLHLCLKRYTGEICLYQFIMDLSDFDEYGWKKSNKPWKSMQERFCPDFNVQVVQRKGIRGKAKETPSLFDGMKEGNQQATQTAKKYFAGGISHTMDLEQNDSEQVNTPVNVLLFVSDRKCWALLQNIIPQPLRHKFYSDLMWFQDEYAKGEQSKYYAHASRKNSTAIEAFIRLINKRDYAKALNINQISEYLHKNMSDKITIINSVTRVLRRQHLL